MTTDRRRRTLTEQRTISVALAAYNGAGFIAGQLQSLLDQTRVPDEIIITDDSPDDSTFRAIEPFLSTNIVRYHRNDSPLGVAKNFEKALQLCSGDIIFLCDQDDFWLPRKVELLSNTLYNNDRLDAVFCNSVLCDKLLNELDRTLWQLRGFTPAMQKKVRSNDALSVFCKRVCCSSHNLAIKRRALAYLLPFPELAPFYPDTWIGLSCAAPEKISLIDEVLTLYRIHEHNQSTPGADSILSARKARNSNAALRNSLLTEEIMRRQSGTLNGSQQKMLQKFAAFHAQRSQYSSNILLRMFQIQQQFFRARYCRFANGIKTAIADWLWGGQSPNA